MKLPGHKTILPSARLLGRDCPGSEQIFEGSDRAQGKRIGRSDWRERCDRSTSVAVRGMAWCGGDPWMSC